MIRLAWHQFRSEAVVSLAALVAVAIVLAVTGPHLVHVYDTQPSQLASADRTLQTAVLTLLLIVPALLGVFFGAPLVARELETGTFRLAWTQSVSRARWLVVKCALVGAAASVIAGSLSLMAAWWANPINIVEADRFSPAAFGMFGIVPFGYALFAFALGATCGILFRRTLPAMATTFLGYAGVRFAVTYGLRPHFAAPLHLRLSLLHGSALSFARSSSGQLAILATAPSLPNAWGLSAKIVDNAGRAPTSRYLRHACPLFRHPVKGVGFTSAPHTSRAPTGGITACVAHVARRFHELVVYQPASRYWPFQLYETALFGVFAVALIALSVWWVRRRLV